MWVSVIIHRQDVCSQDYSLLWHLYWSCYILRAFKFCGSNVVIVRPPQLRLLITVHPCSMFFFGTTWPSALLCASSCPAAVNKQDQWCKNTFLIALPWENLILQLIYACPAISLWSGVENRGKGRTEKLLSFFPFLIFWRSCIKN